VQNLGQGYVPGASKVRAVENNLVKIYHRGNELRKAQLLQAPPSGHAWTSYYFAGSARIAMRVQVNGSGDQVYYLLTDHLGSTAITVDTNNDKLAEIRYAPWGTTRYTWGTTPTDYRFTGQREEYGIGLYFYQARFYDAALGRFAQADSVIPNPINPADFDRYSYSINNPLRYYDPSGNKYCDTQGEDCKKASVPKPDKTCSGDCWDAYLTYKKLVEKLGYVPSFSKILYMTIGSEYWAFIDKPFYYAGGRFSPENAPSGVPLPRYVGREAVARQYYGICGSNGCSDTELFTFLSGYEQWAGFAGGGSGGSGTRAEKMLNNLTNNHAGTSDELRNDVTWIQIPGNKRVKIYDENSPWQFFSEKRVPENLGFSGGNYAILAVETGKEGNYLFMFTALQTKNR
jgi:RHS repeat-associated protein